MIGTCEDCGDDYEVRRLHRLEEPRAKEICEDCAYEYGEPAEPWRPDPREDGGHFGWAGLRD